ncbi:hypothetical protein EHS13_20000 [Paenibacillus psychroresistens]|uniref:Phage ABA sandwich domain-containing protein n=1 Tax=Paenibacillus psychroresistens TaxID=1778678 RepID=A0A6B8RN82_9BACL|nr:hypothetical protein [Paenibacillus psychroresistens]QGQ97005.1 hypothetical protein EHS13_20000 [Paenibacillus psychroresistens]
MSKYTREQIEAMTPEQLKRSVATDVMGLSVYHYDKDFEANCYYMLVDGIDPVAPFDGLTTGERKTEEEAWSDCPDYLNDIAAAWKVIEEMQVKGFATVLQRLGDYFAPDDLWECQFGHMPMAKDESAQVVICKAALLAVIQDEKKSYFHDPDDELPF